MGPPRGGMRRHQGSRLSRIAMPKPVPEQVDVAGASTGLGRAASLAAPARVVCAGREAVDARVTEIVPDGGQALAAPTDVAGPQPCMPSHPPDGPSPRAFEFGEEV